MSKGLEALEKVEDFFIDYGGFDESGEYKNYISLYQTLEYQDIKKELKALEVVKRINFDIVYREQFDEWTLFIVIETQDGEHLEPVAFGSGKEEYDLLREVLK